MLSVLPAFALALTPVAGDEANAELGECLDLSKEVKVGGILEYRTLPMTSGQPDGSTAAEDFRHYILVPSEEMCAVDEAGERIDFSLIQLFTDLGDVEALMQSSKGKRVRVSGDGFGGHTRYHLAPLVMKIYGLGTLSPADLDESLAH